MTTEMLSYPQLIERTGRSRGQIDRLRRECADLMAQVQPQRIGSNLFWPPEAVAVVMALSAELKELGKTCR